MRTSRLIGRTLSAALAAGLVLSGISLAGPAALAQEQGTNDSIDASVQDSTSPESTEGEPNEPAPGQEPQEGAIENVEPPVAGQEVEDDDAGSGDEGNDEGIDDEGETGEQGQQGEQGEDEDGTPEGEELPVGELRWGVKESFRNYVGGSIAHGTIEVAAPATTDEAEFVFPQTAHDWDPDTSLGGAAYAGLVQFTGHDGALDLTIANPEVEIISAEEATLTVEYRSRNMASGKWSTGTAVIAELDLSGVESAAGEENGDSAPEPDSGIVTWADLPATLTEAGATEVFQDFYGEGQELDPVTVILGADSDDEASDIGGEDGDDDEQPSTPTPKPKPKPTPESRAAGTLTWGISSGFAGYVTGDIAKGEISTSNVGKRGGNFLFPQATGSSWNFDTQTGTVRYSGVVTFTGHHGLLSEIYANPVIRVTSASSGTLSVHGQTLPLNLAQAAKSVGSGGAVTWSNVPVGGGISGGNGQGAGGSFGYNSLSFTVGASSSVSYGTTSVTHPSQENDIPSTPPATTGLTVVTPEDELVAGGEIEFEADGFEAGERDILVVVYSEPIVLDKNAGADEDGRVTWVGTLPEDLHGEHTITLQGSTAVGAVIDIMTQEEYAAAQAAELAVATDGSGEPEVAAAGAVPIDENSPAWAYWVGAIGLLVVAAGLSGLVVAQRRRAA